MANGWRAQRGADQDAKALNVGPEIGRCYSCHEMGLLENLHEAEVDEVSVLMCSECLERERCR